MPPPSHSSPPVQSGEAAPVVAVVREVHCLGFAHNEAAKEFDRRYPDNAKYFKAFFDAGKLEPGKIHLFDRGSKQQPRYIFNVPTKVHWKAPTKISQIRTAITRLLEKCMLCHVSVLELVPFEDESGSVSWPQIQLEFLTSFARVPDIQLRFGTALRPNSAEMKQVTIFTDGGAEPNPGIGGFGIVLQFGNKQKELSQGFEHTTNNRMELLATIVALESLKEPCAVRLYSDSRYFIDAVNTGNVFRWRAKAWKNGKVKNVDLWERFLLAYINHNVELMWVKGHSGIAGNERCDALASAAIAASQYEVDQGYLDYLERKGTSTSSPGAKKEQQTANKRPVGKRGPKPKKIGDPCRNCDTPLVRRETKKSKKDSNYYYPWHLHCPQCNRIFHLEEAKVYRT